MFQNKGTLVLKQLFFIDTLLMLFGCFYLFLFISEEATSLPIDDFNFMSFLLFIKPKSLSIELEKDKKINNKNKILNI